MSYGNILHAYTGDPLRVTITKAAGTDVLAHVYADGDDLQLGVHDGSDDHDMEGDGEIVGRGAGCFKWTYRGIHGLTA